MSFWNPLTHRRMRVVLPFALLSVLVFGTLLVHRLEQADPGDPAYLSPGASEGTGSDRLAAALRARGVAVDEATTSENALDLVRKSPGATLFVPAPAFVDLQNLIGTVSLPTGTRIVVAGAELRDLERTGWNVNHTGTRWAAKAVSAGCTIPLPGPAAVLRHRYEAPDGTVCFGGGLAAFTDGPVTIVLVGAADPFRNDRIGEHANEEFATTVLGGDRVVWLSLHQRENAEPEPSPSGSDPSSPVEQPTGDSQATPGPTVPPTDLPPAAGGGQPPKPPLSEAFPTAFWAALALIAITLLAFAAAAARRLGTPVAEPLPSRVPAHETMLGHARLYQRARARRSTLDILRTAARRRLADHLGLPPDATSDEIAERAGLAPDHVRDVLDGPAPQNDTALVAAAQNVEKLVHDVMRRPDELDEIVEGEPS
ncbi:hypothetical protein FB565_007199 [Actinoplanes lutulentus]|uniref:DUF4350 domain-containing protein n=1 Tax=Actinoplanes lutulentus TaxID=1287878 RepID=A0A327ZGP0_9ACTN|nr:DUF4350 domain-containing protein [Actinoplanes lutulentus]MBB2947431.1 hypothetical protein [Actinoplanes lutulentus]RAK36704.1 hypothetical protein B0I29_108294 [Actinoplanes lutulentus]